MNIHQNEPEQSPDFAASWRELKWRRAISTAVLWVGIFSMQWMARGVSWAMWLLTIALSVSAILLSDRFVKAFRCPRCGYKYFGSHRRVRRTDIFGRVDVSCSADNDKSCTRCALPLWSHERS